MNPQIQRAVILLQQDRYKEAVKELRQALAHNPNDSDAYGLLSVCYTQIPEHVADSITMAQQAISLEPNHAYFYSLLCRAYLANENLQEAEKAIEQAIELDPMDANFHFLKAAISYDKKNWEGALSAAEQSLALDAENVEALNLRTMALIKLNRKQEAVDTVDFALKQAPENPSAHANKGWALIEIGEYDEAFTYFKEALRLDPNNQFARSGLKEAIKAKNIVYRGILKYFLWVAKMSERNQWGFIIGAYILYRIILWLAESYPEYSFIFYPIVAFYIIFAFSTWIAMPISNLALRLHPLGKYALDDDENFAASLVGFFLLGSVLSFIGYFALGLELLLYLGGWFGLMTLPLGGTFTSTQEGTKGRRNLILYTSFIGIAGLLGIFIPSFFETAIFIFAIGIFVFSFVANKLSMG